MTRLCLALMLLAPLTALADTSSADRAPADRGGAAPLPADRWNRTAAAHLLRRAGFGGTTADVDALAARGLDGAVTWLVRYQRHDAGKPLQRSPTDGKDPQIDARIIAAIERLKPQVAQQVEQQLAAAPERAKEYDAKQIEAYILRQTESRALQQVGRQINDQWMFQLRSWWLARMVQGPRPLEDKLVLFWTNHFPSSYTSINRQAGMLLGQHALFRQHALRFDRLLHGIVEDPAMLIYLDGHRNTRTSPNENLARELFELFALGEGHYSEADVREAARALTGNGLLGREYHYNRQNHDYGEKTIFGATGRWTGADVVRLTLERKRCARFVAGELATYFLGRAPSDALGDALGQTLFDAGYRLEPMLEQLFRSREFYADEVVGKRIKSPVELLVGAVRHLGLPLEAVALGGQLLPKMGQHLFHPPNVKGWDGGRAWINSSTLLARHNMLADLVKAGRDLEGNKDGARLKSMYLPRDLILPGKQWTTERLLNLPLHQACQDAEGADAALEAICERMDLSGPLSDAKLAELRQVLTQAGWQDNQATRLQIVRVALLISGTPQYQLN